MAALMWRITNAHKYSCEACQYKTYNRCHYERHLASQRHFLRAMFAPKAPFDIKVVVASYLRCDKLLGLGSVGIAAMNLNFPPTKWKFIKVGLGDPPAQTGVLAVPIARSLRNQVSV